MSSAHHERRPTTARVQRGVTLVELVLVMVVLGIIGATAAVFINGPVRAYFDTARRAQMMDAADTATRRMIRELQGALPNSVRIAAAGANVFIELVPIDDSGRYRAATSGGNEPGGTDPLAVDDPADTGFQVLGRPVTVPAGGAQLVVFNIGHGAYDVYAGANRRSVTTAAGSAGAIGFSSTGIALGADSPTRRFFLVRAPVTFACLPAADGSGRIERIDGYALQASQPADLSAAPLAGATRRVLLDKLSACSFEQSAASANANAVALNLQLADSGESVALFVQVYLPNTP
jgi:MSHA biogenesis protein MshO